MRDESPVAAPLVQEKSGADGSAAIPRVEFGTLRRLTPISANWGFDRGLPVDRYYIERFLARCASDIRGRVLEIEDDMYTRRFGGERVTARDILHVNDENERATIVGDLAGADHIPSDRFDCVILTQTLHIIYDTRAVLQTLNRILRPGGVLLATFPGFRGPVMRSGRVRGSGGSPRHRHEGFSKRPSARARSRWRLSGTCSQPGLSVRACCGGAARGRTRSPGSRLRGAHRRSRGEGDRRSLSTAERGFLSPADDPSRLPSLERQSEGTRRDAEASEHPAVAHALHRHTLTKLVGAGLPGFTRHFGVWLCGWLHSKAD